MNWRNFVYNSISMSMPKNIVQFLVGVIIFTMLFGYIDVFLALLGLAGFILTYSSVYLLNDIKDMEEDREDPMKLKWKMIANGTLSVRGAVYLCVVLLVSGLFISSLVSVWFVLMMISLIALNFVYSTFKLKRWMPIAAVFLLSMQFLKFSSGWFAMTTSLSSFPFWLVLTLALAYTSIFVGYKAKFKKEFMKKNKYLFIILGACSLFSYMLSIMSYNFPLSMILLFVLPLLFLLFTKKIKIKYYGYGIMFLFYVMILPMIMVSFIVLANPVAAEMNENLDDAIQYSIGVLPDWLREPIESIKKPVCYDDLNDIINLDFSQP